MLNPRGPVPLYQQLAAVIRERIDSGVLAPGAMVPSEADLVSEFGVARVTVRAAIKVLREQGVIHTVRGEGSFVGPRDAEREPRRGWMFQTIAAELAKEIRAGRHEQDMPLPSEAHLAQRFDVAKGTVRRAVALLREQGWVYTVAGRGTYPADPSRWPDA